MTLKLIDINIKFLFHDYFLNYYLKVRLHLRYKFMRFQWNQFRCVELADKYTVFV